MLFYNQKLIMEPKFLPSILYFQVSFELLLKLKLMRFYILYKENMLSKF